MVDINGNILIKIILSVYIIKLNEINIFVYLYGSDDCLTLKER